jgi:hypothetical protein
MFRCELCHAVVPPRTAATKIVLQTRPRSYGSRGTHPSEQRRWIRGRRVAPTLPYDKGGQGHEIVREASVCPECARQHAAAQAQAAVPESATADM